MPTFKHQLAAAVAAAAIAVSGAHATPSSDNVQVLSDSSSIATTVFPNNVFSKLDFNQLTHRRVDLPLPDCNVRPSDCDDFAILNTLDGFNTQPRISIPFSGPIDVSTVNSDSVFLIRLDGELQTVGINQVVFDSFSNTLHVESDEQLEQTSRYAVIVTRDVRAADGSRVERESNRGLRVLGGFFGGASIAERIQDRIEAVTQRIERNEALSAARKLGLRSRDIASVSVFTTQTVSADLEKIRHDIDNSVPAPADFNIGFAGERTVFNVADVQFIISNNQVDTSGDLIMAPLPLPALQVFPGAVGQIAFGRYQSPNYLAPGEFIPATDTRTGKPAVQSQEDIFFTLFVPAGPTPPGGWPIAIFGHGFTDSKNGAPVAVASTFASQGIATIAINAVGHGFGAQGNLFVQPVAGAPVLLPNGGRGIDQDGNGIIDSTEGLGAAPPRLVIANRDGLRQTTVDLLQLVRVIQQGVDVDGDSIADVNSDRIYYAGQSLGGIYGTIFLGVEPDIRAGVPNVPGGSLVEIARLSPAFRPLIGLPFALRTPSLTNVGGPTGIEFNENIPLRNLPPIVNNVPGAEDLQFALDNIQWAGQSGDPVAFAPFVRKAPLAGNSPKSVIVQFAKGDFIVPNPTNTALIRAGELTDTTSYLRNDILFALDPTVPANPHTFLTNLEPASAAPVAVGAQTQIGVFFATDGTVVIDPDGPAPVFEVPILGDLPEELNFILPPLPMP